MKYPFNVFLSAFLPRSLPQSVFNFLFIFILFSQCSFAQTVFVNEPNKTIVRYSPAQLKQMTMELKYYDEVLTASVLTYAFSGDEKWLTRYNEYEIKLGQLIDTLFIIQSKEDKELVEHLNEVNSLLVAAELEAISSIKLNDR